MKDPSEFSPEELETIRRRLRGERLISRMGWILRQAAYVLVCAAGFAAVIILTEGTWEIIGLIIVAILSSGVLEVLIDWRYSNYRTEWQLANEPDSSTDPPPT